MNFALNDIPATLTNVNTRTEKAGQELDLAKDMDLIADVDAENLMPLFMSDISGVFWNDSGRPVFMNIAKMSLDVALENHDIKIDDALFQGTRIKKFALKFRDGMRADLSFQVQVNPNDDQSIKLDHLLVKQDVRIDVIPRQADLFEKEIVDDDPFGLEIDEPDDAA